MAETPGGVEIRGTHGFTVSSPATYVTIDGFRLTHASGRNSIASGATRIRFTRNIFQCTGDGAYLTVAGHDAEIDRNEFRNKSTVGNMIDVRGSGSQIAQRVWIHHNYFHDFTSAGAQRRGDHPLRPQRPEPLERLRHHRAQPLRPLQRRERADLEQVQREHHPLQHDPRLARHAADAAPRQRLPGLRQLPAQHRRHPHLRRPPSDLQQLPRRQHHRHQHRQRRRRGGGRRAAHQPRSAGRTA